MVSVCLYLVSILTHRRLNTYGCRAFSVAGPMATKISTCNSCRQNLSWRFPILSTGPIYKISYDLSYDYLKFIVRSIYDSDLFLLGIS